MKGQNKKQKGFTIIELIIVPAVIAILGAIAITSFIAMRDNSKYNADVLSLKNIKRTMSSLVIDETLQKEVVITFDQGGGTFCTSTRPLKGSDEFIAVMI